MAERTSTKINWHLICIQGFEYLVVYGRLVNGLIPGVFTKGMPDVGAGRAEMAGLPEPPGALKIQ